MSKPKLRFVQLILLFCLLLITVVGSKAGGLGEQLFSQPINALQNPATQSSVSESYPAYLGHIGGITNAITGQGNFAFTNFGPEFAVLDISNPAQMVLSNSLILSGIVTDIAINNNLAYVATAQNLHVLNISDPLNLVEVTEQPFAADQLIVDGTYLYLTNEKTLSIVDMTDFALVGSYSYAVANSLGQGEIYEIAKSGSIIYLAVRELSASDSSLRLLDVSNPSNPTPSGFSDIDARSLTVVNNTVYLTNRAGTFYVVDASTPNNLSIIGQVAYNGSYTRKIQVHNTLAYLISPNEGLTILNIADPGNLYQEGSFQTSGQASDFFIKNDTVYLADTGFGIAAVDVSNVVGPQLTSSLAKPGESKNITISGQYAYMADGTDGIHITNVTDNMNPLNIGQFALSGNAFRLTSVENYLYVGVIAPSNTEFSMQVLDITNKEFPALGNSLSLPGNATKMIVRGNLLLLTWIDYDSGSTGYSIIDISAPATPVLLKNIDMTPLVEGNEFAQAIDILGNYIYVSLVVGDEGGIHIYDAVDPSNPVLVKSVDTQAKDIVLDGNYGYLTNIDGFTVLDVMDPTNPTTLATVSSEKHDYSGFSFSGNTMVLNGNYVYLVGGSTFYVIDISNPANPEIKFEAYLYGVDLSLNSNFLYINSGNLLHILDVSTFSAPVELSWYETLGYAFNVTAKDNYLYALTGPLVDYNNTGLRIVDISIPGFPVQAGIANDVPGSYDVEIEGNLAYLAADLSGLQIVDISNPMGPFKVGGVGIDNGRSVNVDVSGTYAFVAARYGDLRIMDVSDPASPQEVVRFIEPVNVNDVVVVGNYAYVATEYVDDSGAYENPLPQGMHILDVSDPLNPVPEALHEIPQNLSQGIYGGARRLAIAGDCAYVERVRGGMDIVDIQNPLSPTKMGTVLASPFSSPHQIEIVGNRLYAIVSVYIFQEYDYKEYQFLYVLDISTPCAPLVLGAYWLPYETYNVAATENSIFVASGDAGILEIQEIDFEYMYLPIAALSD